MGYRLPLTHNPNKKYAPYPRIDPIEKSLLKQRLANLPSAQNGYIEKQKKALTKEKS